MCLFQFWFPRCVCPAVGFKVTVFACFCCSVDQPTLCNPMDCSTVGFPVLHHLLKLAQLMSIELVMTSNHLILCRSLLLLPSIFPSMYLGTKFLNALRSTWKLGTSSLVAQKVSKESACNAGDLGSIPGSGRSPGKGNGYPLQDSCLENSMDWGDFQAIVQGVAKSWTQLSD